MPERYRSMRVAVQCRQPMPAIFQSWGSCDCIVQPAVLKLRGGPDFSPAVDSARSRAPGLAQWQTSSHSRIVRAWTYLCYAQWLPVTSSLFNKVMRPAKPHGTLGQPCQCAIVHRCKPCQGQSSGKCLVTSVDVVCNAFLYGTQRRISGHSGQDDNPLILPLCG